ncbi:MAG: NDP-sugar synthase [Frankiaceae bacterium]|nr:NDP-sugar synthase [Frankiaceae bacterium]
MDAVILVGGQGTRLRPLTLSAPKPMLPTAGVPFLAHLLSRIRAAGIDHVVLGTSYQAEVFERHFGDGAALGLAIEYLVESEPLGTGGAIRNVLPALRADAAMIFNGDILSGADLSAVLATHERTNAEVTLHLTRVQDPRAFGCVPTDPDGRVTAFLEKDPNPVTNQINAGTYVFDRAAIESIPAGRPVSVERETFPALLAGGARVYAHVDQSYWRDLGKPSDFVAGSADLVRGIAPSAALPGEAGEALVLPGAAVDRSAALVNGTVVGAGARVGPGAVLDGAVVFDDAHIDAAAIVRRSAIGRGARIGAGTLIEDAVIGDGAVIGARNELLAGIRIWPGTRIPDVSLRFSADG